MKQGKIDTAESVIQLIATRQHELGLSDAQLAAAAGYSERVISLIKRGEMKVPVNKVAAFAQALDVQMFDLLRLVMIDGAPEIWSVFEQITPLGALLDWEVNLLRHVRTLSAGREAKPVVFDGKGVVALVAVDAD